MRLAFLLRAFLGVVVAIAVANCSGGTSAPVTSPSATPGASATPTPTPSPTPTATPTPTPSVSGDFLNFASGRGWNYLVTNIQGQFAYSPPDYVPTPVTTATVSLYDYPTAVDGTTILLEVAVPYVATSGSALTESTSNQFIFGAAGFSTTGTTYTATRYANYTVTAAIPSTVVVSSPLVLGATSTPFAGVTATVTAIGTVPGESVCPTPTAAGATVKYVYGSQSGTIDYVPGCGVTQVVDNKGETWTLQSIGSYPNAALNVTITSVARQVGGATALDTVRSIFGLEHGGPIRHSFAP